MAGWAPNDEPDLLGDLKRQLSEDPDPDIRPGGVDALETHVSLDEYWNFTPVG